MELEIESDSAAARSVAQRQGDVKIRHLERKTLWTLDLVEKEILSITEVKSQDNIAEIGTKCLTRQRINDLKKVTWSQDVDGDSGDSKERS